jgi:hypothetical protein
MMNSAQQCEPDKYWMIRKRGISTRSFDINMACPR